LGWPPSLALLVTWLVAGLPVLQGLLFYLGRRRNGPSSLAGIVTLLPTVHAVQWKRSVNLGILVHCRLNSRGTLGLTVLATKPAP
jgi:hypothetical protein